MLGENYCYECFPLPAAVLGCGLGPDQRLLGAAYHMPPIVQALPVRSHWWDGGGL